MAQASRACLPSGPRSAYRGPAGAALRALAAGCAPCARSDCASEARTSAMAVPRSPQELGGASGTRRGWAPALERPEGGARAPQAPA
eukprot:6043647-Alexandrium_andersonii.AAC.1